VSERPSAGERAAADRLRVAVESGGSANLAAFAETGRDGLVVLRAELTRSGSRVRWSSHDRIVIDGLAAASAAIAERWPAAFLDTFADGRFASDSFVLDGLGRIDDPLATARLCAAATAPGMTTRISVARALRRRASPEAMVTLARLRQDEEWLVRHHALDSLAALGTPEALAMVRAFAPPTAHERERAAHVLGLA
jgi:HEAT repeat protein